MKGFNTLIGFAQSGQKILPEIREIVEKEEEITESPMVQIERPANITVPELETQQIVYYPKRQGAKPKNTYPESYYYADWLNKRKNIFNKNVDEWINILNTPKSEFIEDYEKNPEKHWWYIRQSLDQKKQWDMGDKVVEESPSSKGKVLYGKDVLFPGAGAFFPSEEEGSFDFNPLYAPQVLSNKEYSWLPSYDDYMLAQINNVFTTDLAPTPSPEELKAIKERAAKNAGENPDNIIVEGQYLPGQHAMWLMNNTSSTRLHELTHGALAAPQQAVIAKYMFDHPEIFNKVNRNAYYDNVNEIYSRLMQVRQEFGLDPTKEITEEEIEQMIKQTQEGKKNGYNLIDRYDKNTINFLLNKVAQNNPTKNDQFGVSFAQKGSRLIPRIITPITFGLEVFNKFMPKKKQEIVQQQQITQQPTKRLDVQSLKNDPEYKQFDWYMSEPDLNQLQDSLISRNAGFPQRVAILTNAIAENGGRPGPHGNGAFGVMGWRGPRAIGLPADLPGQLHKLMVESYENPTGKDWTHGGAGTGVQTGKEMYELYNNSNNTQQATKAFMKGYVRPGKEEWDKRLRLADLVKKHMK